MPCVESLNKFCWEIYDVLHQGFPRLRALCHIFLLWINQHICRAIFYLVSHAKLLCRGSFMLIKYICGSNGLF